MRILTSIFLISFCVVAYAQHGNPLITIDQGTLQGFYKQTWSGKLFSAFLSIPYAEPPIDELRFEAPLPAKAWYGMLDATKPHPICPQINVYENDYSIRGNENCLYLNVYTPKLENFSNALLPVMVYIHGGGFMNGHANADAYGPDILLNKNIVFVTINYRLGALGFLSTGDEVVAGNNGLKDQTLALKWVKANIKHFGGDSDRVTIFGQSAGGSSVHYHMLSPLSKGLFSAAIAHSGVAVAVWAFGTSDEAMHNSQKLGRLLNCPTNSSTVLVQCLKKVPAYTIIAQDTEFFEWSYHPMVPFKPVIEKNSKVSVFLPEDPIKIIESGHFSTVPFMTGFTIDDGGIIPAGLYNSPKLIEQLNQNFSKIAPLIFQYNYRPVDSDNVSAAIRKFYFGDGNIDDSTKKKIGQMITDNWTQVPLTRSVLSQMAHSNQTIYNYLFGYRGSVSNSVVYGDPHYDYGVVHSDDLIYLTSSHDFDINQFTEADKKMINVMTTLWTNFATTGNPTPEINTLINRKWLPVRSDQLEYYFIKNASSLTMEKNLNPSAYQFWEQILPA